MGIANSGAPSLKGTRLIDRSEEILEVLQPSFIMVIFVILLYGIYTVLFGLYTYLQIQQQGRIRYYQVSLFLLYLLATASIVIAILTKNHYNLYVLYVLLSDDYGGSIAVAHFTSFMNLIVAAEAVYVAANIIADSLLLYRCYIVWGSSKLVIAGPVVISVVNAVMAFIAAILEKKGSSSLLSAKGTTENSADEAAGTLSFAFLCVNLLTNLILTGLIAGRIWWISRETNRLLSSGSNDRRINGIAAMVLESGLLYPVALIICIILNLVDPTVQVQPLLTMVVGIAPTLIMVRADLGISIENAANGAHGTASDELNDLEMNRYDQKKAFEAPESEGYEWGSATKGKAPQNKAFDASELGTGEESEPLASRYHDAPPPAFFESQQGSSRLISAGPPPGSGEKSLVGGMVVLSPPEEF